MPVVQSFEGTANTLCTNPESDLVCVAGRGLFRIYKISENRFEEHVNLKNSAAGLERRLNLNFSDVAWSPVEDHILVSAATNGTGRKMIVIRVLERGGGVMVVCDLVRVYGEEG